MARRRINTTKREIIRVATKMFLEKGYSATSAKAVCEQLDISTGNLTFYYPTKEHMLAVLVEMLCDFQWNMMEQAVKEGANSLIAFCLELTAIAAICEEDEHARDFYISAYTHPLTLAIIRNNDVKKAMEVFAPYCPHWQEEQFIEAEQLVSGIELATIMTTHPSPTLEHRIGAALNAEMALYQVPESLRQETIQKVLALDYPAIGRNILHRFSEYIEQTAEHAFENQ